MKAGKFVRVDWPGRYGIQRGGLELSEGNFAPPGLLTIPWAEHQNPSDSSPRIRLPVTVLSLRLP